MSGLKQKKDMTIREIVIKNPQPEELDKVDENILNEMIKEAVESTQEESTLPTLDDDKLFKIKEKPQKPPIPQKSLKISNKPDEDIEKTIKQIQIKEPLLEQKNPVQPVQPVKKKKQKRKPLSQKHREALARGRAKALANRRAKKKQREEAKLKEKIKSMNINNNQKIENIQKAQTAPRQSNISQEQFFKYMDNWEKYKQKRQTVQKPVPAKPQPKKRDPMDIYFDANTQINSGFYGKGRRSSF